MATLVTRYIDPSATGANDGTSLSDAYEDWNTALNDIATDYPDFISADVQVDLRWQGGISSASGQVTVDWNMDATRYLRVIPHGAGDVNNTGKYDESFPTIEATHGNAAIIRIGSGGYIIFDGIQFSTNNSSSSQYLICFTRNGAGTLIVRNFHARLNGTKDLSVSGSSTDAFCVYTGSSDFYFQNGVVEGFQVGFWHQSSSDGAGYVSNVLVKDCDQDFFHNSTGRYKFTNCIFEGNAASGTVVRSGSDYNSTDGTAPTNFGANSLASQSVTYEDEGAGDYRLGSSDTALHTAGVGTSNSDVYATDKLGTSRGSSTASIGPYEYVSGDDVTGSGAPSLPGLTASGTGSVAYVPPDVYSVGGPVALILPGLEADGAGAITIEGSGTPSLPSLTAAGVGLAITAITGPGTPTLPALRASGTGQVGDGIFPGYPEWTEDEWFRRRRQIQRRRR